MKSRIKAISLVLGAYLLGFSVLAGVVLDRMLFDRRRSEGGGRVEQALQHWRAFRMTLEKAVMGE